MSAVFPLPSPSDTPVDLPPTMPAHTLRHCAALCLTAFLLSVLLLGLAYRGANPLQSGIGRDRWLVDQAELKLRPLWPLLNRIELELDTTSLPPHARKRAIRFVDSSGKQTTATLMDLRTTVVLPVRRVQESYRVEVINTFIPGEQDRRNLGAQAVSVRTRSKIGIPIAAPDEIALAWLILTIVGLVGLYATRDRVPPVRAAAAGVLMICGAPLAACLILGDSAPELALHLAPPGIFLACILLGAAAVPAAVTADSARAITFRRAVIAVTLAGLWLRFRHLGFGLPENYFHPDEFVKANVIDRMRQWGTFNPHYFVHPALLLYLTWLVSKLFESLNFHPDWPWTARTILAGRTVSAIAGTLSIPLTFQIGRLLFNRRIGLLAAACLAFFPLHVETSHYLKEDVLLLFFILAAAASALNAAGKRDVKYLYLSFFLAGAATATKYSGVLALVFPLSVPWLVADSWIVPSRRFLRHAACAAPLAAAGFFLCSPYSLIDYQFLVLGLKKEQMHMETGHGTVISPWTYFWVYMYANAAWHGATAVAAGFALAGFGMLAAGRKKNQWFVLGAFLLFYLPAEFARAKNSRYIVPCLPFMAIAASYLLLHLRGLEQRRVWRNSLIAVLLAVPLTVSLIQTEGAVPDTRQELGEWMIEHLPPGTKVIIPFRAYAPALPADRFNVRYLRSKERFEELSLSALERSDADYVVLSSLFFERFLSPQNHNAVTRATIRRLFDHLPIVKVFTSPRTRVGYHNPDMVLLSVNRPGGVNTAPRHDLSDLNLDQTERPASMLRWW